MARRFLWWAAVLCCGVLGLIGLLNGLEYALLYHPHPYRANYQSLLAEGAVELPFETNAGKQTAFYFRPGAGEGLPDRIWIVFCGNGSLALDWVPIVAKERAPGLAFLLVDYPGYGKSEGWPTISRTRAAADGAVVALAKRLAVPTSELEKRLNLLGHSLGAAVALDFARRHSAVRRIILLAPFTSLRAEAATIIGAPLSHLFRNGYDNQAALRQLAHHQPPPRVAIFHGLQDRMIPPTMGHALAAQFPGFVTFRALADANHDTVVSEAQEEILTLMAADSPGWTKP